MSEFSAGWYPHSTRPGMLRYYDGSAWTDWVSREGSAVMGSESELAEAEQRAATMRSWGSGVAPAPSAPAVGSSPIDHLPVALGGRPVVGTADQRAQIVCQFCQEQGCVTARRVPRVKRKTATRVAGAVVTMGGSLPLTGVSKKGVITELSCANCGMTWDA